MTRKIILAIVVSVVAFFLIWGEARFGRHRWKSIQITELKLWDVETHQERVLPNFNKDFLRFFKFSPGGNYFASGDYINIHVWDATTWKELALIHLQGISFEQMEFLPKGRTMATANPATIRFWDVETGKETLVLKTGQPGWETGFDLAPDGQSLIRRLPNGTLEIWDLARGEKRLAIETDHAFLAYAPDSKSFATLGHDGVLKVWDPANGNKLFSVETGQSQMAYAPDGRSLATWGMAKTLRGKFPPTKDVDLEPDSVKLWDPKTGKERANFPFTKGVTSVVFSPDSLLLAVGSYEYNVKIFDLANNKELETIKDGRGAAFSPDGKTLAVWMVPLSDFGPVPEHPKLILWDVKEKKERVAIANAGFRPVFSPDSKVLAVGSITLFDVASGEQIADWKAHKVPVRSLFFSQDGKTLASFAEGEIREDREWNILDEIYVVVGTRWVTSPSWFRWACIILFVILVLWLLGAGKILWGSGEKGE